MVSESVPRNLVSPSAKMQSNVTIDARNVFFLVSTSVSTRRKKRLVLPEFLAFKHDCNKYLCSQINGKVLFDLELFSQVCP